MNEHKNHVACLSKSIKKADQDLENIRFYSFGCPTEKLQDLKIQDGNNIQNQCILDLIPLKNNSIRKNSLKNDI